MNEKALEQNLNEEHYYIVCDQCSYGERCFHCHPYCPQCGAGQTLIQKIFGFNLRRKTMDKDKLLSEIYKELLKIEKNEEKYQAIFFSLSHDSAHWGMSYGRTSAAIQIREIFKKHNYKPDEKNEPN